MACILPEQLCYLDKFKEIKSVLKALAAPIALEACGKILSFLVL